jgi:actin-related protein 8
LAAKAEQERHNKKRRKDNGETHELKDGDVDMDGAGAQAGLQNGTSEHAGSRPDEEELVGEDWQNPVDASITALREYLKEHLRLRRLSTNFDEVRRIRAANSRIKPENIPDLNDPHRIEWTDVNGQKYFVGVDVSSLMIHEVVHR